MNRKQRIRDILCALKPHYIEIIDESNYHAGHAGNISNSGESHYKLTIKADIFFNKTRIEQHKMIYNLLAEEFRTGLHAIIINIV